MSKHHKFDAAWRKLTDRNQSPLQNLSARRNWANGVMIAGMIAALNYLQHKWPGLQIQRAVVALEWIQTDIDSMWWEKRDEVRAQLEEANGSTGEVGPRRECDGPQDLSQHGV